MKRKLLIRVLAMLPLAIPVPILARGQDAAQTITIHAKKYEFLPNEITLTRGQPATLVLISYDVAHGLAVKGLDIHADMPKGQPTQITVTPQETGDFKGSCSRWCGFRHDSMKFMVHVVEK